jgi:hypothetical protein
VGLYTAIRGGKISKSIEQMSIEQESIEQMSMEQEYGARSYRKDEDNKYLFILKSMRS